MLSKKQLEAAHECKNNVCYKCHMYDSNTEGMDECNSKLAKTALAYREALEKTKSTIKTLIACNEISDSADIMGEEMIFEIDKLLGECEG